MGYAVLKRLMDIVVSAMLLMWLWPIFVVVAVAIWLETPGSPLFMQERIGLHTKPFRLLKFRSMVKGAAAGGFQTGDNDARITQVGKFLRKTSLDELPQLWNVLVGQMSLVGPRPDVPELRTIYRTEADWQKRHSVRPGITGLAQVRGRSDTTNDVRMANDMEYVDNYSFLMDMRIVWATVQQALFRIGVN